MKTILNNMYINEFYFISGYCPIGYFGAGCADNCNNTCDGCNTVNGLCDSGCHPGWKGFNCEESNVCCLNENQSI